MALRDVLGAISQTSFLQYGAKKFYVTGMTIEKQSGIIRTTDTNSGDYDVYAPEGYLTIRFVVDCFADLFWGEWIPVGEIVNITLSIEETTYVGSAIFESIEDMGQYREIIKRRYSGRFTGNVTITPS